MKDNVIKYLKEFGAYDVLSRTGQINTIINVMSSFSKAYENNKDFELNISYSFEEWCIDNGWEEVNPSIKVCRIFKRGSENAEHRYLFDLYKSEFIELNT